MTTMNDTPPARTKVSGRVDLEKRTAAALGIPQCRVSDVVKCFLTELATVLAEGGSAQLRNVGVFGTRVSRRKARPHPRYPERIIPAKTEVKVTFKAGTRLHAIVQAQLEGDESGDSGEVAA